MPRRVVIDTDPGADDAVALLLALGSPEALEIAGIVAVAGNLPLDLTARNARAVLELAGRTEVPVHAGAAQPLSRPLKTARVQETGGLATLLLPEPAGALRPKGGVDFLVEAVSGSGEEGLTLCALGPLTDVALALGRAPAIAGRVRELVLMGGAGFELGNVTPAAEFNIWVDPDAAAKVLASGMKITIVPLDVTHRVLSSAARVARLDRLGNRCGPYAARLIRAFDRPRVARYGRRGRALHDPSAVAYLIAPELFRGREVSVMVETESELARGMTVVDWWGVTGRPANARFLDRVDAAGVYDLLAEALARLP
ncbi:MAG TPA: nucleoside hydrolase [Stellaceae bacterium]|nr:nucleoside hydrolase [Stellaceae bacterium]